ncbi:MAG: response regulator [Rubrivivax sp.]
MADAASNLPPDPLPLDPGPARVLVVEDEPRLASLLADYLRAAGHHPECVSDGAAALTAWRERQHDLVLLDLMLPRVDGLSVCRQLRAVSRVPIVMLTARADEADRLLGLELGADDYIPKNPFSPREVVARVKAVLRRARGAGLVGGAAGGSASGPSEPAAGSPLVVEEDAWRARWLDQPIDLTPIEFRLLKALSAQPDRVFARAQLLDLLHDDGRVVTERAVDSHVKNLRRKLEQAGAPGGCIRAIYGVGYRFEWPGGGQGLSRNGAGGPP